jgi:DNA-binding GntR family transcriptional regulator
MSPLNRIDDRSRVDQIWNQLRSAILHGQLIAGDRLVELDIAARLGTSQGPVREALQRLEHQGLVIKVAHTGTFVSPLSYDEMREVFAVRAEVEAGAIRRTAHLITPAQCDELNGLIVAMRVSGLAGNMAELSDYDMAFHERLCVWSGHSTLLRVWRLLYVQVQRFIIQTHPHYFPNLVDVAEQHVPLVEALMLRDPDLAAQSIHEHMRIIWSHIEALGQPPALGREAAADLGQEAGDMRKETSGKRQG